MKSIEAIFLSIGVLVFFAHLDQPRAEDTYAPAENPGPLGQTRGARPPVKTEGEAHATAFGKPCLAYVASARPYRIDQSMFDYVIGVTNSCPRAIKIRICQKDGSGCNSAAVPAYRSTEVVMGFGPSTNTMFDYVSRESP
jgi:hypothetical protein